MASCITPQWSDECTPQVQLTVIDVSPSTNSNQATLDWKLEYITYGYSIEDARSHDYSITIDGVEQKAGSCILNNQGSFTIASGTCYPTRGTSEKTVNFEFTFVWNNIWWSDISSGYSHNPKGSISIAAYTSTAKYQNVIIHKKSNTKINGNFTNWYEVERTTLPAVEYGSQVKIDSAYNKNYVGYSTGTTCWTDCDGGWQEKAKDSTFIQPDRVVQIDYYYTPNTYTVTFNANGGKNTEGEFGNSADSIYGENISTLYLLYDNYAYCGLSTSIPTNEGHVFTGWYNDPVGGTQIYNEYGGWVDGEYWETRTVNGQTFGYWHYPNNVELYAHWRIDQESFKLLNVNNNGVWAKGLAWTKNKGVWKKGIPWINVNGTWKKGGN